MGAQCTKDVGHTGRPRATNIEQVCAAAIKNGGIAHDDLIRFAGSASQVGSLVEQKGEVVVKTVMGSSLIPIDTFRHLDDRGNTLLFRHLSNIHATDETMSQILSHPCCPTGILFRHGKVPSKTPLFSPLIVFRQDFPLAKLIQLCKMLPGTIIFWNLMQYRNSGIEKLISYLIRKGIPVETALRLNPKPNGERFVAENLGEIHLILPKIENYLIKETNPTAWLRYPILTYWVIERKNQGSLKLENYQGEEFIEMTPANLLLLLSQTSDDLTPVCAERLSSLLMSREIPMEETLGYRIVEDDTVKQKECQLQMKVLIQFFLDGLYDSVCKYPQIISAWLIGYPEMLYGWVRSNVTGHERIIKLLSHAEVQEPLTEAARSLTPTQLSQWYLSERYQDFFHSRPGLMMICSYAIPDLIIDEYRCDTSFIQKTMGTRLISAMEARALERSAIPEVKGTECSMCLDRPINLYITPCAHTICIHCFADLRERGEKQCISCRQEMTGTTGIFIGGYDEEFEEMLQKKKIDEQKQTEVEENKGVPSHDRDEIDDLDAVGTVDAPLQGSLQLTIPRVENEVGSDSEEDETDSEDEVRAAATTGHYLPGTIAAIIDRISHSYDPDI